MAASAEAGALEDPALAGPVLATDDRGLEVSGRRRFTEGLVTAAAAVLLLLPPQDRPVMGNNKNYVSVFKKLFLISIFF